MTSVVASTESQRCIAVVGGANTDIVGHSLAPLVGRDSNPGSVRMSPGGVARNIAENLARLGMCTQLVTALGDDHNAREIEQGCRELGIGVEHVLHAAGMPGSLYLAILDESGEMELALSDMRPLELLTVEAMEQRRDAFAQADLVVVDANLPAAALLWIAEEVRVPLLLDPVSTAKAVHVRPLLGGLTALKCNALEAGEILGLSGPKSKVQVEYAAEKLLEHGVGTVYVTAGPQGVCYATSGVMGWLERPRCPVVNATGAGDAFTAGVAAGMVEGQDARDCARLGTALAGMAILSENTVSSEVSRDTVTAAMEEMCVEPD